MEEQQYAGLESLMRDVSDTRAWSKEVEARLAILLMRERGSVVKDIDVSVFAPHSRGLVFMCFIYGKNQGISYTVMLFGARAAAGGRIKYTFILQFPTTDAPELKKEFDSIRDTVDWMEDRAMMGTMLQSLPRGGDTSPDHSMV